MKKHFIYSVFYFVDSDFCEFKTESRVACKQFIFELFNRDISYRLRIDDHEQCK